MQADLNVILPEIVLALYAMAALLGWSIPGATGSRCRLSGRRRG